MNQPTPAQRTRSTWRTFFTVFGCAMLAATFFCFPQSVKAAPVCGGMTWHANAGAETPDESVQGDGFFPNEVWIAAGDCIQWTFVPKNEPHTVTFLTSVQARPAFQAGCPGTNASGSSYNGSSCVNSGELLDDATYTVTFPTPGNYKLVCLIHTDMNGTVHVLPMGSVLPYMQFDYERQAQSEAQDLLSDYDQSPARFSFPQIFMPAAASNAVTAGTGEIVATGGGLQYRAVVRFLPGTIYIHTGESVTWTNLDPTEPHTITFGTEPTAGPGLIPTFYSLPPGVTYPAPPPLRPCNPLANPAVTNDCIDPNTEAVLATINCVSVPCAAAFPQNVAAGIYNPMTFLTSGFVQAQAPDRTGLAQLPPGITRITITFPQKGTYYYHCALHDSDGMNGVVVVH